MISSVLGFSLLAASAGTATLIQDATSKPAKTHDTTAKPSKKIGTEADPRAEKNKMKIAKAQKLIDDLSKNKPRDCDKADSLNKNLDNADAKSEAGIQKDLKASLKKCAGQLNKIVTQLKKYKDIPAVQDAIKNATPLIANIKSGNIEGKVADEIKNWSGNANKSLTKIEAKDPLKNTLSTANLKL